ncbi:spore cortex biosynthesis protein YabQ [Clostridium pascui]|uniref:spore cortex biosynthesis protein YabQ n=1 Tax=Clostridium pascui TaxID=46609 RepID=UPI00195A3251|nr:spore cortex biosynthesis protein YabQ [Clostridium pascui]MBM7872005.1 spore cortex biosynthesis protein YabQ [Clostridium pascui]
MLISISHQLKLVIFSFISGVLTGMLFDIYRIIRGFERTNKIITFIEDMLFWIFSSIVVFIFLLFTNYAYIGFYVYLLIALGIYVYLRFLSKVILSIEYKILRSVGKLLRVSKNILLFPADVLLYTIKRKK